MIQQQDLAVTSLGECQVPSPLAFDPPSSGRRSHFVRESERIRFDLEFRTEPAETDQLSFEKAGPRERIFFDPAATRAAIVTCGGLSPGLNNVIRSVFHELSDNYGVKRVLSIRNGYLGLNPASGLKPIVLDRDQVEGIDKLTSSVAQYSAAPGAIKIRSLWPIFWWPRTSTLYFVSVETARNVVPNACMKSSVVAATHRHRVGIPKTIDNDIPYVRQSFGQATALETALEKAADVIRGAHIEARGAINGIGLVKLMGRDAGFIAAGASVVSQEVNFTLIPEIPFQTS